MKGINWKQLKSDTDIRGVALAGTGTPIELTETVVMAIGRGFITWLANQQAKPSENLTAAVGLDSRITGPKLKKYLVASLTKAGVDVYDCGLASTPAMFMSTVLPDHQYDGAVMITASHLPYDKNGFKFFTAQGGLEEADISQILTTASKNNFFFASDKGKIKQVDLINDYSQYIVNKIRQGVSQQVDQSQPLAGLNIIVDAGNGAAGFFADKILKPLGADTTGSQFLRPDGYFPNHIPNPEQETAMEAVKEAVLNHNADLGIIFDTDGDRAAVVDSRGQIINKNKLIALAAAIILDEYPATTIVTDSVTSKGLTAFIENKLGSIHYRYKRGYKHVINKAIRLNDSGQEAHLAIETSGHAAFKENYFLDDGAYLIAKILIKMANLKAKTGNNISSLISSLEEAEISTEYRMTIQLEEFREYGRKIITNLKLFTNRKTDWTVDPNNQEGVRVNCGTNDWFLLRLSLHDPVLVLNIETEAKENLVEIVTKLKRFLTNFKSINLDSFKIK